MPPCGRSPTVQTPVCRIEDALTEHGRYRLEPRGQDIGNHDAGRIRRPMIEHLHPERERLAHRHAKLTARLCADDQDLLYFDVCGRPAYIDGGKG